MAVLLLRRAMSMMKHTSLAGYTNHIKFGKSLTLAQVLAKQVLYTSQNTAVDRINSGLSFILVQLTPQKLQYHLLNPLAMF